MAVSPFPFMLSLQPRTQRSSLAGWLMAATVAQPLSRRLMRPAGDPGQAVVAQHLAHFVQRHGHLMSVQVLQVVARVHHVETAVRHGAHVGDGAHHVGRHRGVDVEPHFPPPALAERGPAGGQALHAAAYVQDAGCCDGGGWGDGSVHGAGAVPQS